jgi:hypothetical protein
MLFSSGRVQKAHAAVLWGWRHAVLCDVYGGGLNAMETVFAITIVCLFSYWVWTLKQEMSELRGMLTAGGAQAASLLLATPAPRPVAGAHAVATHAGSRVSHHGGGIPTWTIE